MNKFSPIFRDMLNVLAIMLVFFALGAIVLAHAAKQQEADCRKGSV